MPGDTAPSWMSPAEEALIEQGKNESEVVRSRTREPADEAVFHLHLLYLPTNDVITRLYRCVD